MAADSDRLLPSDLQAWVRRGWQLSRFAGFDPPFAPLGRLFVPAAFTLDVAPVEGEWQTSLMYVVEDQQLLLAQVLAGGIEVPEALRLLRERRSLAWWKRYALLELVGDHVTSAMDADAADYHGPETDDGWEDWSKRWEHIHAQTLADARAVPVVRRRNRVDAELLARVADTYRTAWSAGDPPTTAVAKAFNVSHSTAARWVGLSRKAELLGPADGSRGGEITR